jgi:hypothetical protein
MTEQERQAAERAAIVNFMGTIFGEAKRIDNEMVVKSSTLQPTSHIAEQALRNFLNIQQPVSIPPTPHEIVHGVGGNTSEPPPVLETPTAVEQQTQPVIVPVIQPDTPKTDNLVEISYKLDTIIMQLAKLIDIFTNQYEDTIEQE